jgi:hypothetical protein
MTMPHDGVPAGAVEAVEDPGQAPAFFVGLGEHLELRRAVLHPGEADTDQA